MKNDQKDNNTKKPIVPRTAEPKARERSVKRLKREFKELGVDMETDGGTNFEVSFALQLRRFSKEKPTKMWLRLLTKYLQNY